MAKKPTYEELGQRVEELEKKVAERKRKEGALQKGEEPLQSIMDNTTAVIYAKDLQGRYILVNRNFETLFNMRKEDVIGKTDHDIFDKEQADKLQANDQKIIGTETPLEFEEEVVLDHEIHTYIANKFPLFDSSGNICGVSGLSADITAYKRNEEGLRERTHLNQILLDALPCEALLLRPNRDIVISNQSGRNVGAVPGKKCFKTWGKMDEPCPWCLAPTALETGEAQRLEVESFGKVWDVHWVPIGPDLYLHYTSDITERKRENEALQASENRYRILAENVADGVGVVQDRKFLFINDAFASIFGYPVNQLVGMEPIALFRDEHRERFEEISKKLEKGIPVESFQAPSIRGDGREIWIEGRHNIIEWKGRPAVLVTVRDVTESKLRKMAMEEERAHLQSENIKLKSTLKDRYKFGDIIGKSPIMQEAYERILNAAASDANVVIYGETGTGKELVARTIHDNSDRHDKPFVPVNCGAIPEPLFESEFFGHRRGAFTGAQVDKLGFFAFAHGGTLFLDEVGELTLNMQVKLLRAIEGGGYMPVGGDKERTVDVRIVAATNRDLADMVQKGLLREDFFYRIHIVHITVPALRDRREDIPLLVDHFFQSFSEDKKRLPITGKIMEDLSSYHWPGNVRELQNVLHRYITAGHLDFMGPHKAEPEDPCDISVEKAGTKSLELRQATESFQKSLILRVLDKAHWHRGRASEMLGIPRRTLSRKIKNLRLNLS